MAAARWEHISFTGDYIWGTCENHGRITTVPREPVSSLADLQI